MRSAASAQQQPRCLPGRSLRTTHKIEAMLRLIRRERVTFERSYSWAARPEESASSSMANEQCMERRAVDPANRSERVPLPGCSRAFACSAAARQPACSSSIFVMSLSAATIHVGTAFGSLSGFLLSPTFGCFIALSLCEQRHHILQMTRPMPRSALGCS